MASTVIREISIRPARPDDAIAVANVHVRSWQVGYTHLLPKQYLESLNPADRATRYDFSHSDITKPTTFVAVENNSIVGFVTIRTQSGRDNTIGELNALYVDPDHWGHGVGTQLLTFALEELTALDLEGAILWVLKGNTGAMRFYERQGWISDDHIRADYIWGIHIEEIRYRYSFLN